MQRPSPRERKKKPSKPKPTVNFKICPPTTPPPLSLDWSIQKIQRKKLNHLQGLQVRQKVLEKIA